MIRPIVALFLLGAAAWAQPASVEGTWQGTLAAAGTKLRLALHVTRDANGNLTSKLDSLDQGARGLPVAVTTFSGNRLSLDMPGIGAKYEATLSADGQEISGTFTQGAPMPLTLRRVERIEELKRPQTPKPPFPYEALEVSYQSKPDIRLGGTLTVPTGTGPFAAAILISGSGPQDRDETLFEHKPFFVIADHLTRRGVAVLRVDDRGIGKSTGNSTQATMEEMAADVLAGVAFLKSRKEIDARRIGVIGHSEGGIVGPLAASKSPDIAFVVMLAGTGVNGEQVMYAQAAAIARTAGAPEAAIASNRQLQQMIFDSVRNEKDDNAAIEKVRAAWEAFKAKAPEAQRAALSSADATIVSQTRRILSPELRSFMFHDPAGPLRELKVPVLAMNGGRDVQVVPSQNLPGIAAALAEGGNSHFTIVNLPGLNHLFQKCDKCSPGEYGELEETFSPAALEILADWLVRHTRR